MIPLYDRGTHIQWKTVDGVIHTGTVRQITPMGYNILDDNGLLVWVGKGNCTRYERPKRKPQ